MAYDTADQESSVLAETAAELDARLRDKSPQAIVSAALATYPSRIALVSSFGAESAILLHMSASVDPSVPVLFLETGHQFGQTLDYRKQLAASLGLSDVRDLRPEPDALASLDPKNDLYKTSTDACCNLRKVAPLDTALEGFDAWITGRKRYHGGLRARLRVVEASERQIKFNPLANWSKAELDAYADEHRLPAHPLVAFGYPSVGCWPCTKPAQDDHDIRAGRWSDSEKTECGIHTPRLDVAPIHADTGDR